MPWVKNPGQTGWQLGDRINSVPQLPTSLTWIFLLFFASSLHAADRTTSRDFITEPPTLLSLGFEWRIDGDDNRNAVVAVSYRRKGDAAWKEGLPLLRIGNERINENAL